VPADFDHLTVVANHMSITITLPVPSKRQHSSGTTKEIPLPKRWLSHCPPSRLRSMGSGVSGFKHRISCEAEAAADDSDACHRNVKADKSSIRMRL
jgi:hypothetical protein